MTSSTKAIATLLAARRAHAERLANAGGAAGERDVLLRSEEWRPRPTGNARQALLTALRTRGVDIAATSFDYIDSGGRDLLYDDMDALVAQLGSVTFVEVKSANSKRVKPGFVNFFFAITEKEMDASEKLGNQHRVVLFNRRTTEMMETSVPEILQRSRSKNWQLSVQL